MYVHILTSVVYTSKQILLNEIVDLSRGREFVNFVIGTHSHKIGSGRDDTFMGGPDRPDFVLNIGNSCVAPDQREK